MFYGQFRHSIDSKGRLIIPPNSGTRSARYIEKFWVTRGIERCVYVYTPREWNLLMAKFKELSLTAGKAGTSSGAWSPTPPRSNATSRGGSCSRRTSSRSPGSPGTWWWRGC